MKKKIKNIVDVRTGYQFRGKVVHDKKGDTAVIQIKDIDDLKQVTTQDLTLVSLDKPDRHFVEPGDVLFLARGHRMFGTVVPDLPRETVVSSYFFVLHPVNDNVIPGYLAWFLNEPNFQRRLQSLVRGSHMPLISRSDFAELPVIIPDLETQHHIARLNELKLEEARLLDQIKAKRAELIEGVSRKLLSTKIRKQD